MSASESSAWRVALRAGLAPPPSPPLAVHLSTVCYSVDWHNAPWSQLAVHLSTMCCCCWSLLYDAILRSRADSLRSHVILHEWLAFYSVFLNINRSGVRLQRWHGWCHMKLLPSRRVLCTSYNHASCHFMQSHIRKVHARLAVTRHLHFWQNDRGLLRATAVTQGWNGYRNKMWHSVEWQNGPWSQLAVHLSTMWYSVHWLHDLSLIPVLGWCTDDRREKEQTMFFWTRLR